MGFTVILNRVLFNRAGDVLLEGVARYSGFWRNDDSHNYVETLARDVAGYLRRSSGLRVAGNNSFEGL